MDKRFRRFVSKFFLGNSLPSSSIWGWTIPGEWGKADFLKQYMTGIVFPVISAIAEEAAKVDLTIERNEKQVLSHDLLKLLQKPNESMSQFQFLEFHFTYMKLCGESYWYLVNGATTNKPKELYLLRPDMMQVVIDKESATGAVSGYVMNKGKGKDNEQTFNTSEVLHFKMPNPYDPYYGLGALQAAKVYIETERYASEWTRNSLYNSGRPSGVLNIKGSVTQEEFDSIKRQYKDQYSGTKNAGKTMFLKGADGIDYQKLGMELGEVALKELKNMSRDDVMTMFRVSKTMLGISEDVNRATARENHAVFIENVIKPELDRFVDHINAFLLPLYGSDLEMTYTDPTMRSDADKLAEWTAGHNKWLTTNDIRKERGLEPLDGGDFIREPISLVPQDAEDNQLPQDTNKKLDSKSVKKKAVSKDNILIYQQNFFKHQLRWEKRYFTFLTREFEKQKKEILDRHKSKAVFPEWVFDVDASKARIVGSLFPVGVELMKASAKLALDLADDKDTVFTINDHVVKLIKQRIDLLSTSTNDETIKKITATITEGIQEGESVRKLRNRILDVYSTTPQRARMIARTESIASSNQGALEAYRQSPVVVQKRWDTVPDCCEFCAELDGDIIGLEENFASIGETITGSSGASMEVDYVDLEAGDAHPQCRCTISPVYIND